MFLRSARGDTYSMICRCRSKTFCNLYKMGGRGGSVPIHHTVHIVYYTVWLLIQKVVWESSRLWRTCKTTSSEEQSFLKFSSIHNDEKKLLQLDYTFLGGGGGRDGGKKFVHIYMYTVPSVSCLFSRSGLVPSI